MNTSRRIEGSFRDPAGHVYAHDNRIYRTVNLSAQKDYDVLKKQGILSKAIESNYLIQFDELKKEDWPFKDKKVSYLLEHPRIPYISYPYEWSFSQLKEAALHHLDFQIFLLEHKAVLCDSTAYNVQFIGAKPTFIDLLSVRPYEEGEFWQGHRQFCEQFLNPLLLRALIGVHHNAWFRGSLEGIPSADLARLLPLSKKFSWNVLSQVVIQAKLENQAADSPEKIIKKAKGKRQLSKNSYLGLLQQMRHWIAKLSPLKTGKSTWQEYAQKNTYTSNEAALKAEFVKEFVKAVQPETLIDLGCNTGDYSVAALDAGAKYVIGFDFDQNALDLAFSRSKEQDLAFLPLFLDASNPSPNQGWKQAERDGFVDRANADALIALAFEHHLAIAKNVPLDQVVNWLVSLAPQGIIEFVPKTDETVQRMLEFRKDIFPDYNAEEFESHLKSLAKIVKKKAISKSGRCLYWYSRK